MVGGGRAKIQPEDAGFETAECSGQGGSAFPLASAAPGIGPSQRSDTAARHTPARPGRRSHTSGTRQTFWPSPVGPPLVPLHCSSQKAGACSEPCTTHHFTINSIRNMSTLLPLADQPDVDMTSRRLWKTTHEPAFPHHNGGQDEPPLRLPWVVGPHQNPNSGPDHQDRRDVHSSTAWLHQSAGIRVHGAPL